jgi:xanthine dehydrogenase small subunit
MFELPVIKFEHTELQQQLQALQHDDSLNYESHGNKFFAPKSVKELLELRSEYPQSTILAGGTDVGLWVNKQFRDLGPIIYTGEVQELKQLEINNNTLRIGAAVTLTDAYQTISEHYPEMDQMWERFASMPIRNVGTLGGNVANGSPIGDSMPALIALGARVVLNSIRGDRTLLLEDFYIDYMQKDMAEDEIVEAIELPLPSTESKTGQQFRCYKLSKRQDSDISAVFAAFAITLDGETVKHCQFAYGGMAAIPKRATSCEKSLVGKVWNESTIRNAMKELEQDYAPMSDMRASDQNRMQSAQNLLYRFYLETRLSQPLSNLDLDVFAL